MQDGSPATTGRNIYELDGGMGHGESEADEEVDGQRRKDAVLVVEVDAAEAHVSTDVAAKTEGTSDPRAAAKPMANAKPVMSERQ